VNIIRYHKEEEFKLIKEKNLIDFVRIHSGEKHFRSVAVPFGVEAIGKDLILWKERRV